MTANVATAVASVDDPHARTVLNIPLLGVRIEYFGRIIFTPGTRSKKLQSQVAGNSDYENEHLPRGTFLKRRLLISAKLLREIRTLRLQNGHRNWRRIPPATASLEERLLLKSGW